MSGGPGRPTLEAYAETKRLNEAKRADKRAAIERLLRDGLPATLIAQRLKCSERHARAVRREMGLPPAPRGWEDA